MKLISRSAYAFALVIPFINLVAETKASKILSGESQLFYEIILQGLKNLEISSDYETGFEMTLVRLLAFKVDLLSSENPLKALVNNETVRFDDAPVEESVDNTERGHQNVVQETDLSKTDLSTSPLPVIKSCSKIELNKQE